MISVNLCLGIDIGEANISAMYIERDENGKWGEATPVKIMDMNVVSYPSYFTINSREEKVIGQSAKNYAGDNPVLSRAKSLLATKFESVDRDRLNKYYGLSIGEDDNGYATYDVVVNGERRLISPKEVYKVFIERIIEQVKKTSHHEQIDHVMITVPVSFDGEQRGTFKSIVEQCGIPKGHITTVFEPMATAMLYVNTIARQERLSEHNILVFDLGSGTFDMSIVSLNTSEIKQCYNYGDRVCAGHDLTLLMMQLIMEKHGNIMDSLSDKQKRQLLLKAEKAKEELSTYTVTEVDLSNISNHFEVVTITREAFEGRIAEKIDAIISTMDTAITKSPIGKETISRVILVGGSTFIPLLRKKLDEYFGRDIIYDKLSRNTSVAEGAAIYKPYMDNYYRIVTATGGDGIPEQVLNEPDKNTSVTGGDGIPEPNTGEKPPFGYKVLGGVLGGGSVVAGVLSVAAYYLSKW